MCEIPKVLQDYLQYFKVTSLNDGETVSIRLPTETLIYKVCSSDTKIYLNLCDERANDTIFKVLDILDCKLYFVKDVVGYVTDGSFPELKSKKDLLKLIIALDQECIKKFGNKCAITDSDFKVGDSVLILPRIKKDIAYTPMYTDVMEKYAGKIARIAKVFHNLNSYYLDIDAHAFYWSKEALGLLKNIEHKAPLNPESESESESKPTSELNLFPTKKHYQLNFNY